MINDILKYVKGIEIRKIGEDDRTVSYALYYNNMKVGMLTINKEYDHIINKIIKFIELLK